MRRIATLIAAGITLAALGGCQAPERDDDETEEREDGERGGQRGGDDDDD